MADIELIPRDYLAMRLLRKRLLRCAVVLGLLLVIATGARGWLGWRLASERPRVEGLREAEKSASERQARLLSLQARKAEADVQLASLATLRNGAAWQTIFRAIDGAHNPSLWFDSLSYSREVQLEPPVVAARPSASAPPPPALRYSFELQGHALAHAAITDFMRALGEQPGIAGVRLAETGLRRYATVEVVDFKLSGSLDPNRKASP